MSKKDTSSSMYNRDYYVGGMPAANPATERMDMGSQVKPQPVGPDKMTQGSMDQSSPLTYKKTTPARPGQERNR